MYPSFLESIISLLYPRRCPVCQDIVTPCGRLICPGCIKKLSFVRQPVCKKCGKELLSDRMEYCFDCTRHRRSFEYGMALLNYNDAAKVSMGAIKYRNKREYVDFYGQAIAVRYEKQLLAMEADVLIPVPVHPSRRRTRGYNQAELLARVIGQKLGMAVCPELLKRRKKTAAQKGLTSAERLKNLEQAFETIKIPQQIERVILVDDIYTTGSTIEACTRVLKAAGVKQVYYIAICIGSGL